MHARYTQAHNFETSDAFFSGAAVRRAVGRIILGRLVSHRDGSLSWDTPIHHEVRDLTGRRTTHKWITVQRLFERFQRIEALGRGKGRLIPPSHTFHVPAMNNGFGIFTNRVLDVECTGKEDCHELVTKSGFQLTATAGQRLFNGEAYVSLRDLAVGATVYVHNNETKRRRPGTKKPRRKRRYLNLRWHPNTYLKKIRDRRTGRIYEYYLLPVARAAVEAALNNLTLDAYVQALNTGNGHGLVALPTSAHVHHIDEDAMNDGLENLDIVTGAAHAKRHLQDKDRDNDFRFIAVPDVVTAIRLVGKRPTYNVKVATPHDNYVADHFVVHSS